VVVSTACADDDSTLVVTIVTEPFVLPVISRRLAIVCDPFGNLIELAEVLG
jgi:hypothetical protein